MKLITLLLLVTIFNVFGSKTYSQYARLNLDMKDIPIQTVLNAIEGQSEFFFLYSSKMIDVTQKVDIHAESKNINEVLDNLLKGTEIKYSVKDRQILLVDKETYAATNMQQQVVTGKVTDSQTGEAMPGVNIVVKGSTIGTMTDASGKYSLAIPDKNAALVISFIGYGTQEVLVAGKSVIDVALVSESKALDEVVVVGYGTQRRATLTGSVASVTNQKIVASPSLNVTNALSGLMTGVITKMSTGEPGRDNPLILIRGQNTTGNTSPLVVVDGVQGVSGWERINTSDIESISVLKDASAAIYGARSANGVILITTKRGSIGKPSISYIFNQGITQPTRIKKYTESADFAGYINQLDVEAGRAPRYTDAEIEKFRNGTDPNYLNTDWFGTIVKKSSFQSQHNLAIRGGSEIVKYSVSGSYTDEGSMFVNGSHRFKTYSLRSNIDAQINKNLKVGVDINGALENGNFPTTSTANSIEQIKILPFYPVFWPANGLPYVGKENTNPATSLTDAGGNINSKTYRLLGKVTFDLTIPWVKGLDVDGYFVYNNVNAVTKDWRKTWIVYDYDKSTDTYIPKIGGPGGITSPTLSQSFSGYTSPLVNLRIKYELNIKNHNLSTFIAGEQSTAISNNFNAFRKNFNSAALDEMFAGSLIDQSTGGTRSESGRLNLFGRVSYGFMEKYLLDFNFRDDGSSNFPKGNRFGFFPGTSVAWRISEENFMKNNVSFINNLKLRASVGQIGNDAVDAFQYLTLYSLGNTGMSYGYPPVASNGLVPGVTPNSNITWEVGTTSNIGVDASFWKGLFGLTVDLFEQKRTNILAKRDLAVPIFTGLTLPNENIGIVVNRGIEMELSNMKVIGDFSWRVAGTFTYNRNKVVDISEPQNVPEWKKQEGHVLGASQYYHTLGIFRTQEQVDNAPIYPGTKVGDLQYWDRDGDGTITSNDMYTMDKSNIPRIVYGLNLSMNYKQLSLYANFAGAAKVWQYFLIMAKVASNEVEEIVINRYTPGSMDSKYPRLPTSGGYTEVSGLKSDFWLKNVSYCRLKTLELSYDLPKKLLSKVKIQSLKLVLNGQNLFIIDWINKWADPENTNPQLYYYPQSRIFNLGINLTL